MALYDLPDYVKGPWKCCLQRSSYFPEGLWQIMFYFLGRAPANKFLFPGGAAANDLFHKKIICQSIGKC